MRERAEALGIRGAEHVGFPRWFSAETMRVAKRRSGQAELAEEISSVDSDAFPVEIKERTS
jgi:hypothetical protein